MDIPRTESDPPPDFTSLPVPKNYYLGYNFPPTCLPREVVVFYRNSSMDAQDYGEIAQHHRYVLYFCLESPGTIHIGDHVFNLHSNEGGVVFPYQPHHFVHFSEPNIAWLFISFELTDNYWLAALKNRIYTLDKSIRDLLEQIATSYNQADNMCLVPQVTLLLNKLVNSATSRYPQESMKEHLNTHQQDTLSASLDFIHSNLKTALPVDKVAETVGCSEAVLRNLFKKYLNISVAVYIRRRRVLRACHLLQVSDQNVGEIGERCGFSSPYSFSRTFSQVVGLPPEAYRRQAHN